MELLGILSTAYEIPEAYDYCMVFLHSKKETLIEAAISFLDQYTSARKIPLSPQAFCRLQELLGADSKYRSTVEGALNYQTSAGFRRGWSALEELCIGENDA